MRILLVGPRDNATMMHRREALINLGHSIQLAEDRVIGEQHILPVKMLLSIFKRLGIPLDHKNVNRKVIETTNSFGPHIVWINKGLVIKKRTILTIKQKVNFVIHYNIDDIYNKGNFSIYFKKALPFYDIHFTTKINNIEYLKSLGAGKVVLTYDSYSRFYHYPRAISRDNKIYDISFVGGFEEERADYMFYLAKRGLKVHVWGNNWGKYMRTHPNLIIHYRQALGKEYNFVMNSTKIVLSFLRKANNDVITTRSFEIPACGAFALAEFSEAQSLYFGDKTEIVYFQSREDLHSKALYYLKHDDERERIASNGHVKVNSLKRSYTDTLAEVLNNIICE